MVKVDRQLAVVLDPVQVWLHGSCARVSDQDCPSMVTETVPDGEAVAVGVGGGGADGAVAGGGVVEV
jgi:hypothetical protein